MELEGNSNSGTSAAFLDRLRQRHSGLLGVVWDNAPAHRGEAVREYLRTPGLALRLMNLPGYSPDFNADETGERGSHRKTVPSSPSERECRGTFNADAGLGPEADEPAGVQPGLQRRRSDGRERKPPENCA